MSLYQQYEDMDRADLESGKYEEQVPESIREAIQSVGVHQDAVAGLIGASFYNTAWLHQETGKHFTCSGRFAAGLIARQRNLYVKGAISSEIGDLFGVYKDWKDETYPYWLSDVYAGGVFPPFEAAMNERGWVVDEGYWDKMREQES